MFEAAAEVAPLLKNTRMQKHGHRLRHGDRGRRHGNGEGMRGNRVHMELGEGRGSEMGETT
jgi:hypothetical protein